MIGDTIARDRCCECDLIVIGRKRWGIQDLSWMMSRAMTRDDTSRQKDRDCQWRVSQQLAEDGVHWWLLDHNDCYRPSEQIDSSKLMFYLLCGDQTGKAYSKIGS